MGRIRKLVVLGTALCACAGVVAQAPSSKPSASAQAQAYFTQMIRAQDSTGVEQAACVSHWTLRAYDGVVRVTIERVRAPRSLREATPTQVTFSCGETDATVHTHAVWCSPSALDKIGREIFGVVVCPNPIQMPRTAQFAVYAVRKPAP